MPPGFSGRDYLFVETDVDDVVFENGLKANNVAAAPNTFDVMPIAYADLAVSSIGVSQPAGQRPAGDRHLDGDQSGHRAHQHAPVGR